jgi:hypothetical protein
MYLLTYLIIGQISNAYQKQIPYTPISDYDFSPAQPPIRDTQPGSKRKADYSPICPMPKRAQGIAGMSLTTPAAIVPLKEEDTY